ncbi:putative deoxyhypusine synthase [Armadillidium nasatum]|uniref:deoxyhypusine synthase n=1 Tax=Armadillidium nasatum TaxID=96803 RepID=A0A5N5SJB0_9CRUS|nr:putative deoxyhypusine synthase [Armadillidium nasatum]
MSTDKIDISKEAVLAPSEDVPKNTPIVEGYDFNNGINHHKLLKSYKYSGFQATSFGNAVDEIMKMIECRDKALPSDFENFEEEECFQIKNNCTIFLGYTSNMVSCGVRESIRFLVEHKMVDCIVTTAGGVEEDFIKCLAPTYIGDWTLKGTELRPKGINRIGNLLVPNNNYCKFEDFVMPLLDEMLEEQKSKNVIWSPSKIIHRLGERINDESCIAYWAAKNKIPVFSPAITDGSLGDMMYFHGIKNPGLIVDINSDLRRLNNFSKNSLNTGMIIVGGGLVKHHICNANLMRNGANFSVFLNTGNEFDGSDSGARPDEAVSWGKIRMDATPVKIYGEASLIFPLLVAETFARRFYNLNDADEDKGESSSKI